MVVSAFSSCGYTCWKKSIEGLLGELGQNVGLWRSEVGVEHFANPENHANRGFLVSVKSNCQSTTAKSMRMNIRTFVNEWFHKMSLKLDWQTWVVRGR